MGRGEYEAFLRNQRRIGSELHQRLLPEALGESDYLRLCSEAIAGSFGASVLPKLPLMMAFGHEFCLRLAGLAVAPGERALGAAELCALFNLGISLFDILADQRSEATEKLAKAVDAQTLHALIEGRSAPSRLRKAWAETEEDGLRILLALIAAFYARLHSLQPERPYAAEVFQPLLLASYRAELASTRHDQLDIDSLREISKVKSAKPFEILGQITRLGIVDDAPQEVLVDEVAPLIGEIFWILDDLVDVSLDVRSGSLNSLLLDFGITAPICRNPDLVYPRLHELLASDSIERAVSTIVMRLGDLGFRVRSGDRHEQGEGLQQLLLGYIRCWIQ